MPGLFNPPGYAQAKLIWTLAGDSEPMVVTFGVDATLMPEATVLAEQIDEAWQGTVPIVNLGTSWTYRGVEVQLGTAEGSGGEVGVAPAAVVGTAGLATLPQNCAALAHKRSNQAGRKNRGRLFMPSGYVPESYVNANGQLDAAFITGFGGLLSDFLDALNTDGIPMVILHSLEADEPTTVTNLVLDPVLATQRTRLRR